MGRVWSTVAYMGEMFCCVTSMGAPQGNRTLQNLLQTTFSFIDLVSYQQVQAQARCEYVALWHIWEKCSVVSRVWGAPQDNHTL
jgi:hypothetical protein